MMKKLLAATAVMLFSVGCNTMEGVGEDIQAGGKKLENAAERKK